MKKSHLKLKNNSSFLAILCLLLFFPATGISATLVILSFGGSNCNGGEICGDGSIIDQSYGDIAGQLDVIWDANIDAGGNQSFLHYTTGFVGTDNVGYTNVGGAVSQVLLATQPGYQVTLNSFDWTPWPGLRNRSVKVFDETGDKFISTSQSSGNLTTYDTGDFGVVTSSDLIGIQFVSDPGGNVGIDNISFTISEVPLPAAALLFGSGLLGLIGLARRKQA